MGSFEEIRFLEGEFTVKTLSDLELAQAYRLRHRVFAEILQWVPSTDDGQEMDMYDLWGTSVGLLRGDGSLLGLARLLPASGPFMLEQEFGALLPSEHRIRKEPDTAEITRLAVDPDIKDKGLSAQLMLTLLKGVYQWAVANDIRYYYLEVEHRFLRVLRALGFPCEPLGPPVVLPPAGAASVAALYDMRRFDEENARRRPKFLEWMSTVTTPDGRRLSGLTSSCRLPEAARIQLRSLSLRRRPPAPQRTPV